MKQNTNGFFFVFDYLLLIVFFYLYNFSYSEKSRLRNSHRCRDPRNFNPLRCCLFRLQQNQRLHQTTAFYLTSRDQQHSSPFFSVQYHDKGFRWVYYRVISKNSVRRKQKVTQNRRCHMCHLSSRV